MIDKHISRKSSLTGKQVIYSITDYCDSAKWASLDEVSQLKFEPLRINELKDLDSLVESIQERVYYTGNVILGNSKFIEDSSNCTDSFYVLGSGKLSDCKYIGYSTFLKSCEYLFGCQGDGPCSYMIRSHKGQHNTRCFEQWKCQDSSDCCYVHGLHNCNDCMFSFNLRNKRNCIGNLELSRDKYLGIKKKLIAEITETLRKDKKIFSLAELVNQSDSFCEDSLLDSLTESSEPSTGNMDPVNSAFEKTSKVILQNPLREISHYSGWLMRDTKATEPWKSIISGKKIIAFDYSNIFFYPKNRIITEQEVDGLGPRTHFDLSALDNVNLEKIRKEIGKIAYFSPEIRVGNNTNLVDCTAAWSSSDSYMTTPVIYSRHCGYSFWPRESEFVFGTSTVFQSKFCMKSYYSERISRCFEVDSSYDCSDSYYLHNCENVQNGIMCFNAKNLSYAVGNTVVGKEKFAKVKGILLEWINGELERNRSVPLSIFNLGGMKNNSTTGQFQLD